MKATRKLPHGAALAFAMLQSAACQSAPTPIVPGNTSAPPPPAASTEPSATAPVKPPGKPAPTCSFDPSWIGASSLPTDVGSDDCSFHQFMWQSFVYLTQAIENGVMFESWMPNYGIFVDKPTARPTPWGVEPQTPCSLAIVTTETGAKATPAERALPVYSSITKQPGVEQPLIDRNGNQVYYGIAVNKIAYDWLTSCELYRYGCAAQLDDQKAGVDLIKNYPTLAFPVGSVELKTSWKVLTDAEVASKNFYSVKGQILTDKQGAHKCKVVNLGLVGLHVVSKTASHPEFIWATFEHKNNAPDCTDLAQKAPIPGGWTFFDKAAYDACKEPHCTNTYVKGKPANVCREHPWGDSNLGHYPDGNDCTTNPNQPICQPAIKDALAKNTAAMKALNVSASAAIAGSTSYNPVWANYELVGNVWSQGGVVPPITQAQAGSLSAANTTMETFVQNGQAGVTNPSNCFTCHDMVSSDGTTNLPPAGLSHIFRALQPKSGGCKSKTLPKTCVVN